jgi:hypothetical protein
MISEHTNLLIPDNIEGKPIDIQKTIQRSSVEAALYSYDTAKTILLRPFLWENLPGFKGAEFELVKADGSDENVVMHQGDFIKINIPGPGPHSGDGFDWVTIETIEENFDQHAENSLGIKLRPCPEPGNKSSKVAAHFFKDKATSTFILKRSGKIVTAYYHGRNEIPNLKGASLFDKLRNAFVSLGALAGLSKLQWKLLINGLFEDDEKNTSK